MMGGFFSWIGREWFSLAQTIGIIGTLLLTRESSRREEKALLAEQKERAASNRFTLSEQHRTLWAEARSNEDLWRILRADADLDKQPLTVAEEVFLNSVIVHYWQGWECAIAGTVVSKEELSADVRGFFSLPLPHAAWEKTKKYRDAEFVEFVEQAIERGGDVFKKIAASRNISL